MRDEVMQSRPETEEDRKFIEMVERGELTLIPARPHRYWDTSPVNADPVADIERAIKQIEEAPPRSTVSVHSPRCRAVETNRLIDCNCFGGI